MGGYNKQTTHGLKRDQNTKETLKRNGSIILSNARVLLELKLLFHSSFSHIADLPILSPSDKLCEAFAILLHYLTFTVFFQNVLNYVFIVDLLVHNTRSSGLSCSKLLMSLPNTTNLQNYKMSNISYV